ncbi:MAG: T9SS type A sorting domain-containing protein [bacterium]
MKTKNYFSRARFPRICFLFLYSLILFSTNLLCQPITRTDIKYDSKEISINQLNVYASNRSLMSSRFFPKTIVNNCDLGVKWPGGKYAFKPMVDCDGFVIVGIIDDEIRAIREFETYGFYQLQPGKMFDDGTTDNWDQEKYRVYKIQKNWESMAYNEERDQLEKDYNEWPVEDGAPWKDIDGDGIFSRGIDKPLFYGDEVLFYVCNDADTTLKHWEPPYYSKPLNLEFQVTVFGFKGSGDLSNTVFRKYKIINKSNNFIDSIYVGCYSWPLMGFCSAYGFLPHTAAACDTTSNMAYSYCFTPNSLAYEIPPAIGYILLQSPIRDGAISDSVFIDNSWKNGIKSLGMTSFTFFKNYYPDFLPTPIQYQPPGSNEEFFNTMKGLLYSGLPMIDPWTHKTTKYAVPGDPVSKKGWYDHDSWGNADSAAVLGTGIDRELLLSSGPFTMAPGDTHEVVIATIAAQGKDNFDSVTQLKRRAKVIQKAYYSNFQLSTPPPSPTVHFLPEDQSVTLWWDDKAETYDEQDPYIFELGFDDTTYTFEGYIIRQYRDSTGSDPRIIKMFDKTNGISVIEDYELVNGTAVKVPVLFGNDDGIVHYYKIDTDDFSNGPLLSGSEYYFSIPSYAFSLNSSPTFIESPPKIFKVIPGKEKIDYSTPYPSEGKLLFQPDGAIIDSKIEIMVVDPSAITGEEYKLSFCLEESDVLQPLRYTLTNSTTSDTLIYDSDLITTDTLNKPVIDGFMILIDNSIQDSVVRHGIDKKHAIKDFIEVSSGKSVMDIYNSTNKWKIKKRTGAQDMRKDINWQGNVTYGSYELRFTPSGSEYYTTGYIQQSGIFQDDPKGKGTVPFEAWKIGKESETRLMIKVWDKENKDSVWTHNETTNEWERLFIYEPTEPYSEPLPQSSGMSEAAQHLLGNLIIEGEMPEAGTIIRVSTFRPIIEGDEVTIQLVKANTNNTETAKERKDEISVFPNPYFAGNNTTGQDYVRFTGLPVKATIRIYSLAGVFIRKYEKEDMSQYIDWDLRNEHGEMVASGIYIAYIEMPGIGNKILKVAVINGKEYLNTR